MSRAVAASVAFSLVMMLHVVALLVAFDGHHNVGPILVAQAVAMLVLSATWSTSGAASAPCAVGPEGRAADEGQSQAQVDAIGLRDAILIALEQPGLPAAVRVTLVRALGQHSAALGGA
ncbi:MAG: hypothetical protein RL071_3440 [Pseudomonadota bacterium]